MMYLQGGPEQECPDLDFVYDDTDIHANEISELYSYTEQPELQLNVKVLYFYLLYNYNRL